MLTSTEQKNDLYFSKSIENTYPEILTEEALDFIKQLHLKFDDDRLQLLEDRKKQQAYFDKGNLPSFDEKTKNIRESEWTVNDAPADLRDRRVEITGPVDRKMVINALNSGANVFMADFEDSNSPSWDNVMNGQKNMLDANRRTIDFTNPTTGKEYKLNSEVAVLLVRPRGLHLNEKHMMVDGQEISASLFDFGLYVFHNTKQLLAQNTAPYFYLPKLEHYNEARWWNEVFVFAQQYLNVSIGTFKATL